jgi:hypothetical protein
LTAGVCAALLALFVVLSYGAAKGWFGSEGKSAAYDEPLHVLGGFLHRHYDDFRVNPEDPALFGWLVSLPNPKSALKVDRQSNQYRAIVDEVGQQWPFIWLTLYRTPGNDEQHVLNRARAACTTIGVILGALVAWWSYRLAGGAGAVAATTLYALCPNFLAHASIVKNDVPLSCVLLGLTYSTWLLGRRASWPRLASVALLCGAALGIKYSGVLGGPIVLILLTTRALMPQPWEFVGFNLQTRLKRLMAALTTCAACALVAWACVWAFYGFRFNPTPDPGLSFNMANLERLAKVKELQAADERTKLAIESRGGVVTDPTLFTWTEQEFREYRPARVVRVILWMNEHKVMPQGWLAGFLYTYATTLLRSTYLNGNLQNVGWWYFFPLAMLYKTPAATLVAAFGALLTLVVGKIVIGRATFRRLDWWATACLLVTPLLYGTSAMSASLNLGLRHVLPVYPYVFIGVGVVVSIVIARWRLIGFVLAELLALGLLIETLAAYPNYLAFFNVFAGGSRGGFELLGDSNLDWGQELKALAKWQENWQKHNPDKKLYLSYFGIADPESYGVKAVHLPGGYIFAPYTGSPPQNPTTPGVLAISATNLQGIYHDEQTRKVDELLRGYEPFGVINGAIYLYEFPLRPETRKTPAPE